MSVFSSSVIILEQKGGGGGGGGEERGACKYSLTPAKRNNRLVQP